MHGIRRSGSAHGRLGVPRVLARPDGQRTVLDIQFTGDDGTAAWRDVIGSLVRRSVARLTLAMIDRSARLAAACREQWPAQALQRGTAHKLRNLEAKAGPVAR